MKTHEFHIALLFITLVAASVTSYNYFNREGAPNEGSTYSYECDISEKSNVYESPMKIEPPRVSPNLNERENKAIHENLKNRAKVFRHSAKPRIEKYRLSASVRQLFIRGFTGQDSGNKEVSALSKD